MSKFSKFECHHHSLISRLIQIFKQTTYHRKALIICKFTTSMKELWKISRLVEKYVNRWHAAQFFCLGATRFVPPHLKLGDVNLSKCLKAGMNNIFSLEYEKKICREIKVKITHEGVRNFYSEWFLDETL